MKTRVLALAVGILIVVGSTVPAQATGGSRRLQDLAAAQTKQLFRYYNGQPQTASPQSCNQAGRAGAEHTLLLPTLSFGSGDDSFNCRTSDRRLLVDLGGFAVTEDDRGDTYSLADGEGLTFTRANLPRICADAVRFLAPPAPATLDGQPIAGAQVTTGTFRVRVNPGADNTPGSPYYQDSIDLGHPGRLAACYVGYKALVRIGSGQHVLRVDLSTVAGAPTTFTYRVVVRRHR